MPEAIDREEWFWKNDLILSHFSFEFAQKIKTNPMYKTVYTMIVDPNISEYQIIEELLKMNENQAAVIIKLQENQQQKYFIKQ